jgi:hypothetical protein
MLAASVAMAPHALAQDYYPLKPGNRWDYLVTFSNNPATYVYSVKVVGDSTFRNGKKYFILDRQDNAGGRFIRSDSVGVYYYSSVDSTEFLLFKSHPAINEVWQTHVGVTFYMRLGATDTQNLFGKQRLVCAYQCDGLVGSLMSVADGIGPIYYYSTGESTDGSFTERRLQGCIISDTVYGKLLVSIDRSPGIPKSFRLSQNYPNPFNPGTMIRFEVPFRARISLQVYSAIGQLVSTLVDESKDAGTYQVWWYANVPSGVYFCRFRAGGYLETRKMLLIR